MDVCRLMHINNVDFNIIKIKLYMFGIADFSSEASGNYLLKNLGNDSR